MNIERLIVASISTHSVFERFAKLSDEDKGKVVKKVKQKLKDKDKEKENNEKKEKGKKPSKEEEAEKEESVEEVEEGMEDSEAPDNELSLIVDGLQKEIKKIQKDGKIQQKEVMGLMDNVVQMVMALLGAKPAPKGRKASDEFLDSDYRISGVPGIHSGEDILKDNAFDDDVRSALEEAYNRGRSNVGIGGGFVTIKKASEDYIAEKVASRFRDEVVTGSNKSYEYKLVEKEGIDGPIFEMNVTCSWDRVYGRADRRTHRRYNTLYTQKQAKAWARRNGVDIPRKDIEKLPKNFD